VYLRVISQNLPYFLGGLVTTIEVALFGAVAGLLIAVITASVRLSAPPLLKAPFIAYVEAFRNTPLLVQALILFFGPTEFRLHFDGFQTLAVVLALNTGAYMSEIIRGGLQSVPRGQLEAAASIGLSGRRTFTEIVLPQAIRAVYPAMSNQFIAVVLASSIGVIIGAGELTSRVLEVNSRTFRTTELLLFLTVAYVALALSMTTVIRAVGRRLERAY